MSIKLSAAALANLPAEIAVPEISARRSQARASLHFGVGNFHRAHQAVYLDDLFNAARDHDWAMIGAGVRAADALMREKLARAGLADDRRRAGGACDEARASPAR